MAQGAAILPVPGFVSGAAETLNMQSTDNTTPNVLAQFEHRCLSDQRAPNLRSQCYYLQRAESFGFLYLLSSLSHYSSSFSIVPRCDQPGISDAIGVSFAPKQTGILLLPYESCYHRNGRCSFHFSMAEPGITNANTTWRLGDLISRGLSDNY